jgi:hypothetical protein
MARTQSKNRRWHRLLDARYGRESEGLSTARESKARVWLSGNEAGGALLPGQRRTLGGRARNFTDARKPALSTTWPHLHPRDILLADRGFCSFFSIHSLQARGVDSVVRLHQRRRVDFRRGKRLRKDDILLDWTKPTQRPETLSAEEFKTLPTTLTVRLIRLTPNIKGFRVRTIILVTTLLDPIALSSSGAWRTLFPTLERGLTFPRN